MDVLSLIPVSKREEYLSRFDLSLRNISLQHLHGDYTATSDLRRIRPEEYDNILVVANDWLDSHGGGATILTKANNTGMRILEED